MKVGDEDRRKLIQSQNIKEKDPSSTKGNRINKKTKKTRSLSSKRWEQKKTSGATVADLGFY